ncbi:hypothetical protein GF380_02135, partial [Candidatus Uhrbacteria bacterium]|nr:hypothetical protein [Candidatus Uhrbacteria bacterium]MBD3284015.1 hypothetical protein [Candidatus Uhrbacteria bacterium]
MAKRKSIREQLNGWFGSASNAEPSSSEGGQRAALIAELQAEQRRLAAALEEAFRTYDAESRAIAQRLAQSSKQPITRAALTKLRHKQEELWRVIRRAQAAQRTTRQLEQELKDWSSQVGTDPSFSHPDHPGTRTEIVASELRIRGRQPESLLPSKVVPSFEGSARDVDPYREALESASESDSYPPVRKRPAAVSWQSPDPEQLLEAIAASGREVTRLRAKQDPSLYSEIVMTCKDLRCLHAALRLHDQLTGMRRHRVRLGWS